MTSMPTSLHSNHAPAATTHWSKRPLTTVFVAGLAVLAATMALRNPATPTAIGVVDLEVVYDKLDQHRASEAKLTAMVDGLRTELQKREQVLKMLQLELETGHTPQSQGYLEMQGKVEAGVGQLRAYQEFAKIKTERESERLLKETYDEVKAACAEVAKERGIQLVLLDDATPAFAAADPRPMMQQISARRSLFVDPSLDITAIVIDRMNSKFAATGGSTTSSAAPTPAAPASPTP